MSDRDKPLVWLHGEVRTPPFSPAARIDDCMDAGGRATHGAVAEAGHLLRRLQQGESLGLPHSRPMSSIGSRCHELRINDRNVTWRVVYRADPDAIVILEVFGKTTTRTPVSVIDTCKRRLRMYDDA